MQWQADMRSDRGPLSWLPGVATIASLLVCYGTLAVLALLGLLGVAIALNETLWAGAIVATAVLAVGGLALGARCHHRPGPLLIGALGAAVIAYAMYVDYARITEISGFALLGLAAFRDWRLRRNH